MDGLATSQDMPAAEKTYSHAPYRRPSDSSSSLGHDDDITSPTSSVSHHEKFNVDVPEAPLTPAITQASRPSLSRNITRCTTHGTTYTSDPSFEVDFEDENDPLDPRSWSTWYKSIVLVCVSYSTLVVVLYSTSYTSTLRPMQAEFNVESDSIATLGVTTYLLGLAVGSLLLAPISETYGRKPVYVVAMFCFFVLVLPSALARSMEAVIISRFFCALAGSAMIANAPGTIGDMVSDEYRAIAFSVWSLGPINGPVAGPVILSWVTQYAGWRWASWVVFIAGFAAFLIMVSIPETYAPTLLQQKAAKARKEMGENRYWSRYDVRVGFSELMKANLSRPFVMAVKEPICIFWNLYIGIVYGILYLCFVAYPIVFTSTRGWSIGMSGLAFLGIGIGNVITIACASPIKKMIDAHKPDATGHVPPEAMMSVVCIAAVLIPIGELWFAWTCLPVSIHPVVSIAAGIPFGMGNAAVFIYASNYLVHSYGIYAASAMAGNAVIRSVLGGTLPLAGLAMYRTLGANWASTLLGLLEVAIIPIPFVFYRYGFKIRERSTLIRQMREIEERQEAKRTKATERQKRSAAVGVQRMEGDNEKEHRGTMVRVLSDERPPREADSSKVHKEDV